MQRPELVPSSPFVREYQAWAQAARADGDGGQSAIDQVLADHFMMDIVLSVITREAHALAERRPLRTELWDDVVDFVGNYVHQIHRRKEEQALFPALAAAGLVHLGDEVTTTIREHQHARALTVELLTSAGDGDWESVIRVVSAYVAMLEPHMAREERHFLVPLRARMDAQLGEVLRAQFRAIEAVSLEGRGRMHYLRVVQRLAAAAGLSDALPA